jgi:hypothetical protein
MLETDVQCSPLGQSLFPVHDFPQYESPPSWAHAPPAQSESITHDTHAARVLPSFPGCASCPGGPPSHPSPFCAHPLEKPPTLAAKTDATMNQLRKLMSNSARECHLDDLAIKQADEGGDTPRDIASSWKRTVMLRDDRSPDRIVSRATLHKTSLRVRR